MGYARHKIYQGNNPSSENSIALFLGLDRQGKEKENATPSPVIMLDLNSGAHRKGYCRV